MNEKRSILWILLAMILTGFACSGMAGDVPAQLPDPDGKPGDATKPVKVYILAGQSNMVGMGNLSGARCRYSGIYLTADPAAPEGPMYIYPVGHYKIASHGLFVSADAGADSGAMASVYKGAFSADTDYDKAKPVKTERVALGVVKGTLPSATGPHTVVVRGFLEVRDSGGYTINVGYGDSAYNIMILDGEAVYRKSADGKMVRSNVALKGGRRYPFKITYINGGSTALWLSKEDLVGKGDLEIVTKRDKKFQNLVDDEGNWTVRNDVYYYDGRINFKGSPLSPTSNGRAIGPELGFGHVMGTFHDEQVLLIKTAMGNRSLGFDFRPPSSGRTDPDSKWESLEYKLMVEGVRKTLARIDKIVPGYKGQGYEIAGFAWWQGHKDGGSPKAEYEKHLVNLIKDVRKEFKAPRLPAVVATVGFGGHGMNEKYLPILAAQMAVGDPKQHPEFAGTVASVDIRDFWREVDDSPVSQDYHYNRNAETYLLVGDALGRAMVRLLGGKAEALPKTGRPKTVAQKTSTEPTEQEKAAGRTALVPIVMDSMAPDYILDPRNLPALVSEANGKRPQRVSQFFRGAIYRLTSFYRTVGIEDYNWHVFGTDLRDKEWDYYSFDPPETMPRDKWGRYRNVTFPDGMADWFAPGFDAAKAGWKKGLPPFGQVDGKLAPPGSCGPEFCGCGIPPRTLWEKEVLAVRGTFEVPPLKAGHRYRIVIGGSAHVNTGEGFAIYVNGKLLAQSTRGVAVRQGGQPRGGYIYNDFRDEFKSGKVTIAVISFLQTHHPRRKPFPPRGHLTVWLEEQELPPIVK